MRKDEEKINNSQNPKNKKIQKKKKKSQKLQISKKTAMMEQF